MLISLILLQILQTRSYLLGSLNNYYSTSDISPIIANLSLQYPGQLTSVSPSLYRVKFNSSVASPKKVLLLGGFSAGSPQGPFQVLYTIQYLLDEYKKNSSVLSMFSIDFSVIPNELAYNKSLNFNRTTNNITAEFIFGDLISNTSLCSTADYGINPDMNFPANFYPSGQECSVNYTGKLPFTSPVAKKWEGKIDGYLLVINYQGTGNYYLGENSSFAHVSSFLNQVYIDSSNIGCSGGRASDLIGQVNGSFIDYVYSRNVTALQVALGFKGVVLHSTLENFTKTHSEFLYEKVLKKLSQLSLRYLSAVEKLDPCEPDCYSYSQVNISFSIANQGLDSWNFSLLVSVNFTFNENYESLAGLIIIDGNYSFNLTNSSLNEGFGFNYTGLALSPGETALIVLVFLKYQESEDFFNLNLETLSDSNSTLNSMNLAGVDIEFQGTRGGMSYQTKVGLGVGIALGILLIFLVLYCAYKYKKRRKYEPNQI